MPTDNFADTWLPVFPGFYNTLFDISEQEYRWVENLRDLKLVPDDWRLDFDYSAYTRAVAKCACDWVEREFARDKALAKFGITAVELQQVKSPREYNFVNDSIDCRVRFDTEVFAKAFAEYLTDAADLKAFAGHLRRHYQSRSGFCSFYPYTVEEWAEETGNWTFAEGEISAAHGVGRLLEFLLENEDDDCKMSMYYHVSERVYPDEFVLNYPEDFDHETANERESFSL